MSSSDADHKPLDIRIVLHRFEQAEVSIPVFEVEISQEPSGMWCETFGTLGLLNAFLRGIRCGLQFRHAPLTLIPSFRETPSGWNLQRAPYQLWPEHVPGEDVIPIAPQTINWCYGCKRTLPDNIEIEHDDLGEIPWHRTEHKLRSDRVRIGGLEVPVCGPVFRRKPSEAMKTFLEEDR